MFCPCCGNPTSPGLLARKFGEEVIGMISDYLYGDLWSLNAIYREARKAGHYALLSQEGYFGSVVEVCEEGKTF